MTKVLVIGNAMRIERLWNNLERSKEAFDIPIVVLEDSIAHSEFLSERCQIIYLKDILSLDINSYDLIFICSQFRDKIKKILTEISGEKNVAEKVYDDVYATMFLPAEEVMGEKKEELHRLFHEQYIDTNISMGAFTYGKPTFYETYEKVSIGKFCSIAENVSFISCGEHRTDWVTTYPFNIIFSEYNCIEGNPSSKGPINIGNDVWLGNGCKILSGVTIGDGAVVGANALVTKNVPAYSIVGGVPAKVIRYRFSEEIRKRLLEIKWWDWPDKDIFYAVPLLQSNKFEDLFQYYETNILGT